jgi:phospholipase/lecithinase/hemolysin
VGENRSGKKITSLPPKKGTRKNPTSMDESTVPKPIEAEIEVQDPPKPQEREHAASEASSTLPKNHLTITDLDVTPFEIAKDYLYKILAELQDLHDTACRTKATITMEHTFTKITTTVQKVWEQIKALQRAHEESIILKSIKHIQASITGLEKKV